jgi:hypothetical protein
VLDITSDAQTAFAKLRVDIGAQHLLAFHILLSADVATPARLLSEGYAVAGSDFTYSVGRLALWSCDPERIGADGSAALEDPGLRFVALSAVLSPRTQNKGSRWDVPQDLFTSILQIIRPADRAWRKRETLVPGGLH